MGSKGIAIVSELQAASSHKGNRLLTREMFCTLKHHVLHEVGHTAFILLLNDASAFYQECEIDLLVRRLAATNIIGQAILQNTLPDGGIGRYLLLVNDIQMSHQQRVGALLRV